MQQAKDDTIHKFENDRWQFDENVAHVFNDMLARSIPGIYDMRQLCASTAAMYTSAHSLLDIGASNGGSLVPMLERWPGIQVTAVEPSAAFCEQLRENFPGIELIHGYAQDLVVPSSTYDIVQAVLTMMFIPTEHRHRIYDMVYRALTPGGVFIIVDKILGRDSRHDTGLTNQYYSFKYNQGGYSWEQIATKARSLEGVQICLTEQATEAMLEDNGLRPQKFWQYGKFAAWICTKQA